MGIVLSKLNGCYPSRSESISTSTKKGTPKKWHGLVFPVSFLHCDDKIFDGIQSILNWVVPKSACNVSTSTSTVRHQIECQRQEK